jgi:hypothetical protein
MDPRKTIKNKSFHNNASSSPGMRLVETPPRASQSAQDSVKSSFATKQLIDAEKWLGQSSSSALSFDSQRTCLQDCLNLLQDVLNNMRMGQNGQLHRQGGDGSVSMLPNVQSLQSLTNAESNLTSINSYLATVDSNPSQSFSLEDPISHAKETLNFLRDITMSEGSPRPLDRSPIHPIYPLSQEMSEQERLHHSAATGPINPGARAGGCRLSKLHIPFLDSWPVFFQSQKLMIRSKIATPFSYVVQLTENVDGCVKLSEGHEVYIEMKDSDEWNRPGCYGASVVAKALKTGAVSGSMSRFSRKNLIFIGALKPATKNANGSINVDETKSNTLYIYVQIEPPYDGKCPIKVFSYDQCMSKDANKTRLKDYKANPTGERSAFYGEHHPVSCLRLYRFLGSYKLFVPCNPSAEEIMTSRKTTGLPPIQGVVSSDPLLSIRDQHLSSVPLYSFPQNSSSAVPSPVDIFKHLSNIVDYGLPIKNKRAFFQIALGTLYLNPIPTHLRPDDVIQWSRLALAQRVRASPEREKLLQHIGTTSKGEAIDSVRQLKRRSVDTAVDTDSTKVSFDIDLLVWVTQIWHKPKDRSFFPSNHKTIGDIFKMLHILNRNKSLFPTFAVSIAPFVSVKSNAVKQTGLKGIFGYVGNYWTTPASFDGVNGIKYAVVAENMENTSDNRETIRTLLILSTVLTLFYCAESPGIPTDSASSIEAKFCKPSESFRSILETLERQSPTDKLLQLGSCYNEFLSRHSKSERIKFHDFFLYQEVFKLCIEQVATWMGFPQAMALHFCIISHGQKKLIGESTYSSSIADGLEKFFESINDDRSNTNTFILNRFELIDRFSQMCGRRCEGTIRFAVGFNLKPRPGYFAAADIDRSLLSSIDEYNPLLADCRPLVLACEARGKASTLFGEPNALMWFQSYLKCLDNAFGHGFSNGQHIKNLKPGRWAFLSGLERSKSIAEFTRLLDHIIGNLHKGCIDHRYEATFKISFPPLAEDNDLEVDNNRVELMINEVQRLVTKLFLPDPNKAQRGVAICLVPIQVTFGRLFAAVIMAHCGHNAETSKAADYLKKEASFSTLIALKSFCDGIVDGRQRISPDQWRAAGVVASQFYNLLPLIRDVLSTKQAETEESRPQHYDVNEANSKRTGPITPLLEKTIQGNSPVDLENIDISGIGASLDSLTNLLTSTRRLELTSFDDEARKAQNLTDESKKKEVDGRRSDWKTQLLTVASALRQIKSTEQVKVEEKRMRIRRRLLREKLETSSDYRFEKPWCVDDVTEEEIDDALKASGEHGEVEEEDEDGIDIDDGDDVVVVVDDDDVDDDDDDDDDGDDDDDDDGGGGVGDAHTEKKRDVDVIDFTQGEQENFPTVAKHLVNTKFLQPRNEKKLSVFWIDIPSGVSIEHEHGHEFQVNSKVFYNRCGESHIGTIVPNRRGGLGICSCDKNNNGTAGLWGINNGRGDFKYVVRFKQRGHKDIYAVVLGRFLHTCTTEFDATLRSLGSLVKAAEEITKKPKSRKRRRSRTQDKEKVQVPVMPAILNGQHTDKEEDADMERSGNETSDKEGEKNEMQESIDANHSDDDIDAGFGRKSKQKKGTMNTPNVPVLKAIVQWAIDQTKKKITGGVNKLNRAKLLEYIRKLEIRIVSEFKQVTATFEVEGRGILKKNFKK